MALRDNAGGTPTRALAIHHGNAEPGLTQVHQGPCDHQYWATERPAAFQYLGPIGGSGVPNINRIWR